ncbi:MAG: indole-3-glycerol-phosphate synthase [Woeseiaceae bacterium]|nr:indole-3-glycerol-phosphate synthase [Woeseiaceae bacterium]
MARDSERRVTALSGGFSSAALDKPAYPLKLTGFDVIAEIKNRSPAEGVLGSDRDARDARAQNYIQGGAAAISVLTEPRRFDGDIGHLEEVVTAASSHEVPVMRKDFLVDEAQILEAKAAGASGVLLIAAILDDRKLAGMLDCAFDHELFVLLEAFDESDLQRVARVATGARVAEQAARQKFLVGVNTRDLRTLEVDSKRLPKLASKLPPNATAVAESGLSEPADAASVVSWGYRAALIGTALMRAGDPGRLIADMLDAGRRAVAE